MLIKIGLSIHVCQVVRSHSEVLDILKETRANTVRVSISISQGRVVVHVMREVAQNGEAKVLEGRHPWHQELHFFVYPFAHWLEPGRGRSGLALRLVED
jgi:hypothetical protein